MVTMMARDDCPRPAHAKARDNASDCNHKRQHPEPPVHGEKIWLFPFKVGVNFLFALPAAKGKEKRLLFELSTSSSHNPPTHYYTERAWGEEIAMDI